MTELPRQRLAEMYKEETLVFGHRGASAYAPMNTIPAFELAAQQGADGVELDVHLSKDGRLIVLHDFTVDHTTNGTGYARDMTLAELRELDAGIHFGEHFRGTQVPTLDEVFEAVGGKLVINIEIKSETRETDGVEQETADCIARHAMDSSVIVSSFNPYALQRFRKILPDVPIGYLFSKDEQPFAQIMRSLNHEAQHPYHDLIDAAYMEWARSHNYLVNTWTINEPERAIELKGMKVNGIITDKPDVIGEVLRA